MFGLRSFNLSLFEEEFEGVHGKVGDWVNAEARVFVVWLTMKELVSWQHGGENWFVRLRISDVGKAMGQDFFFLIGGQHEIIVAGGERRIDTFLHLFSGLSHNLAASEKSFILEFIGKRILAII